MSHTTLTIRKLAEPVKQRLRIQAARHGRSMEAEAREILTAAVAQPESAFPSSEETVEREGPCARVRGVWSGRGTTDAMMETLRGGD